ncbi:MAG: NYN domain-containing protein [Candidatus Zixiibacteriota bacterium]|nr:MAG: NYN domain-containing protein [candidate division Zixibacteria bacterium]
MKNSKKGNSSDKRVAVFVDGFNVYHFLDKTPGYNKYKWLNYRCLAEHYCPRGSIIVSIYYFTAFVKFDSEKNKRHNVFIRALKTQNIITVKGKFKPVKRKFVLEDKSSTQKFKTRDGWIQGRIKTGYTFEEKKTDVNIAVYLLTKAIEDEYDIALVISGDTDFETALKAIKGKFLNKELIIVVPDRTIAGSLRYLAGKRNCFSLEEKHLKASQLNDPIFLPNGDKITKPLNWA